VQVLDFSEAEIAEIYRILAAILHVGKLKKQLYKSTVVFSAIFE